MTSTSDARSERKAWDPLSGLSTDRIALLKEYDALLGQFNQRVNLISRETGEHRWTRHILHSLCLAWKPFPPGARVVDWGTGGGLPAIPLAIAFPDVRFLAVDAVGRKVMAVRAVIRRLELDNIEALQSRAEECDETAEYSVSRATAPLADLWDWHVRVADPTFETSADGWARGLVCLKGGDLTAEIGALQNRHPGVQVQCIPLADVVSIPEFVGKVIVTVTASAE